MPEEKTRYCNHSCECYRVLPNYPHADVCLHGDKRPGDHVVLVRPGSECRFGLLEHKAQHAQSSPSRTESGEARSGSVGSENEIPQFATDEHGRVFKVRAGRDYGGDLPFQKP